MAREKTHRIVLYRLKSASAVETLDFTDKDYVLEHEEPDMKLFLQVGKRSEPGWVKYIGPLLERDATEVLNSSCSFILLLKSGESGYALTGGYGYTEVEKYMCDDFGLQVAVRMIDNISGINQRAMKGTTRQVFRAVAGYDPLFDRENYNRILKWLKGKGEFEGRSFQVSGRSSLVLRTGRGIEDVSAVLEEVEGILTTEPKVHFPKSYEEVEDQKVIEGLNERSLALCSLFWQGQRGRDDLYLELEDPVQQFRCERFIISWRRQSVEMEDFDLELIRDRFVERGSEALTEIDDLQKIRVRGINDAGHALIDEEPLWNMLVCELKMDGEEYIKLGKRWYRILREIQDFYNSELGKLSILKDELPSWDRQLYPEEKDFNRFVADSKGWYCLDADFVHVGGYSKLELCDVYDPERERFFHIKRTWGCKSAYLFTQGTTAAQSYRESRSFRAKCEEKWPELFTAQTTGKEVVFGICDEKATNQDFPLNMSYFAKVNLYAAVTALKAHDYDVALAPVAVLQKGRGD